MKEKLRIFWDQRVRSQQKPTAVPFWMRVAICCVILTLMLSRLNLKEMFSVVINVSPVLMLGIVALQLLFVTTSAGRWYSLLRCVEKSARFLFLLKVTFGSIFIGLVTPGTIGVEVARIVGAARANLRPGNLILCAALDRVLGALALAVVVAGSLLFYPKVLKWQVGASALALVLFMTSILIVASSRTVQGLALKLLPRKVTNRYGKKFTEIGSAISEYRRHPLAVTNALFIAFGAQFVRILTFALAAYTLGLEIPFSYLFIVVPLVTFLGMLPISIMGLGISEVSYVYFLGLIGVPQEGAFALSIVNTFTFIIAILPGGLVLTGFNPEKKEIAVGKPAHSNN